MIKFRKLFVVCSLLLFSGNLAIAEDTAIDRLKNHGFLSAVITDGEATSIHHEVCNLSDRPSALLWKKAGMGIDALNQLYPRLCARRTQGGVEKLERAASHVAFQDGTNGEIDTIYQCHAFLGTDSCNDRFWGEAAERITELSIFLSGPDENNVQMETITIGVRNLGDGLVEIFIESSDGVEHAAIIVNSEDVTAEEIRDLLGGGDNLQIDTFDYFREIGEVESSFLTEGIRSESPTLMFRRPETGGMRHFYKMKDINRLGELLSIIIIDQGRVVAIAETPVPLE